MSVNLTINGVTYAYPETGDLEWGSDATNWASAVTSGALFKSGGAFTLAAEVDFGASYGLKTLYYKSQTADPASAGQVRLAVSDVVSYRNNANDGDLDLGINASDQLLFNSILLADLSSAQTFTNKTLTSPVIDTGVSGTAILDEDDLVSDSATQLATQQSIKAYVDAQIGSKDTFEELNDTPTGYGNADELPITNGTDALVFGKVKNINIDAAAAIVYSKLSIADADLSIAKTNGLQTALNAKLTDPMTTDGDMITQAAGVPARVGIGSSDQIWKVVGGTGAWADASGGGYGQGLVWTSDEDSANSPFEDVEYKQKVWLFSSADIGAQKLFTSVKVPTSYLAGKQIKMKLIAYTPSSSDEFLIKTTSTLINENTDAVDDTTNQHVSTNTELTSSVAKQSRTVTCDLSDASGEINSVAVTAGDTIIIDLYRSAVSGTEDSEDSRFIPSLCEVTFDG